MIWRILLARFLIKKKKNFDGMITVRDSIRNPYFNQVEKNDEGYLERSKSLEREFKKTRCSNSIRCSSRFLYI